MAGKYGKTVFVVCLLSTVFCIVSATLASEQESESVEVTFYQMTEIEWGISESAFKTLMAAEASTYCASNSDCGLAAGFSFTASQVGLYSGPTVESKSLKIKFYIEFPALHILSSSSNTTYVVNSAVATVLITSLRSAIESAVGHEITYIGDEFYSINPDAQLNTIIIPAAFAVLLLMIVLMIILQCWSKQKEKAEKQRQRDEAKQKRRLKSGRVRPTFTLEHERGEKQSDNFWPRRPRRKTAVKSEVANLKRDDSGTDGSVPSLSMKTNMFTANMPTPLIPALQHSSSSIETEVTMRTGQ